MQSTDTRQHWTLPALGALMAIGAAAAWYFYREDRGKPVQSHWRDIGHAISTNRDATGNENPLRGSQATDENSNLIASNKVEGTAVYDGKGEKLGNVNNFMVGKRSGRVAYAIMSFGGWLGLGETYHPLPWNTLSYDTSLGGYVVSLNKDRLRNAPSHMANHDLSSDASYWDRVTAYWA